MSAARSIPPIHAIHTEASLLSACTMVTVSGRVISLREPKPEDIELDDIAHHLSMLCRYTGAVRRFYSVAEHSFLCSLDPRVQTRDSAIAHLLHDAAEAYLGDVVSPLKRLMRQHHAPVFERDGGRPARSCYDQIEERMQRAIEQRFGLADGALDDCHAVDLSMCMREQLELRVLPQGWRPTVPPATVKRFACWGPDGARAAFMVRAVELGLR